MKPILVHIHIYYPDLWPELKACVLNINPHPFELFVTMVEEHKDVIADIKATFPEAHIEIVENRGYDVAPFIHILNQIDLDKYSYIVKLHTKRDMPHNTGFNNRDMSAQKWRTCLLFPFETRNNVAQTLSSFQLNDRLGAVTNFKCILPNDADGQKEQKEVRSFLNEHHLSLKKYSFVAGTMFIIRAHLLQDIKNLHLSIDDFQIASQQRKTQFAHILERLLGFYVYYQGYTIKDSVTPFHIQALDLLNRIRRIICRFFYQKKNTKSGKLIIKIIRIPVYIKRERLDR